MYHTKQKNKKKRRRKLYICDAKGYISICENTICEVKYTRPEKCLNNPLFYKYIKTTITCASKLESDPYKNYFEHRIQQSQLLRYPVDNLLLKDIVLKSTEGED